MPTRVRLQHAPPSFVSDGSWFFITLCCATRRTNQLCLSRVSGLLLEDAAFYHRTTKWGLHLLLLMPDHLHAIIGFPPGSQMNDTIRNWKRLTARRAGIDWQKNFFDHRLRPDEGLQEKAHYIRHNPVRAGLAQRAEDWPHFIDYRTLEGR